MSHSNTQGLITRGAKPLGRKRSCLTSLLPALQQLICLGSFFPTAARPPRPESDGMLAELGHGCIGRQALFPELLSRTRVRKQACSAMWETLTCHARPWGNLQANVTVASPQKDTASFYLGWLSERSGDRMKGHAAAAVTVTWGHFSCCYDQNIPPKAT